MILVPLFEPEVRSRPCGTICANFGFGAPSIFFLISLDRLPRVRYLAKCDWHSCARRHPPRGFFDSGVHRCCAPGQTLQTDALGFA
jgi:hypothetical protein